MRCATKWQTYCLTSDGEHQEGNTWEGVQFAGKNRLRNLTVIVDRNNIQIDGFTENIMPLEPFREKYESFGWHVLEIDGHSFEEIIAAVARSARDPRNADLHHRAYDSGQRRGFYGERLSLALEAV